MELRFGNFTTKQQQQLTFLLCIEIVDCILTQMEDLSFLNIDELLKSSDDAMWEFELARFVREYETISTTRMQTVPIAVYITTILNKLKEISDMDRIRLG